MLLSNGGRASLISGKLHRHSIVCVDCPHFSRSFYVTVGGLLEAGCTVLGSVLFNTCLAGSTYRKAFAVTQVCALEGPFCISQMTLILMTRFLQR